MYCYVFGMVVVIQVYDISECVVSYYLVVIGYQWQFQYLQWIEGGGDGIGFGFGYQEYVVGIVQIEFGYCVVVGLGVYDLGCVVVYCLCVYDVYECCLVLVVDVVLMIIDIQWEIVCFWLGVCGCFGGWVVVVFIVFVIG